MLNDFTSRLEFMLPGFLVIVALAIGMVAILGRDYRKQCQAGLIDPDDPMSMLRFAQSWYMRPSLIVVGLVVCLALFLFANWVHGGLSHAR